MYVAVLEHAAKIERTLKVDGCAAFLCENLDVWFAQYGLKNRKVMVIYASSLALLSHCYPYGEMAYRYLPQMIKNHLLSIYPMLNMSDMIITNTCVSSIDAIQNAWLCLMENLYDYVIVIGYDFNSDFISDGLDAMQLLSSEETLIPFANPKGIVLSSGVGMLLLSGRERSKYTIRACSVVNDSVGIASIEKNQRGLRRAIDDVLLNSKIEKKGIDLVMCSCNGTQEVNDAYISAANAMGFSEEAVCSIKKQHVLGATGVIELHLCLLGIEEGNLAETLSFYHHFVPPKRSFFPPFNILFLGIGFSGINGAMIVMIDV